MLCYYILIIILKYAKNIIKIHNTTTEAVDLTRIDYNTHMTSPHVINNNPNDSEHIRKAVCIYLPLDHEDTLSSAIRHGHNLMSYHPYQTLYSSFLNVKSSFLFSQSACTTISQIYLHMSPVLSAVPERTRNHMETWKLRNTETQELIIYSEPRNPNLGN